MSEDLDTEKWMEIEQDREKSYNILIGTRGIDV